MSSNKVISHNQLNNNSNSNTNFHNSPAIETAINYVHEFSLQVARYKVNKSEEALLKLNRNASLVSTAIQPQHFNTNHVEMSKFFIDLHTMIDALTPNDDTLWSCIDILQNCCRNLELRRVLVEEYRFLPILAQTLTKTRQLDKVQRLIVLLQDLTYGIRITWEEPYILTLLQELVNIIYNATDETNESMVLLALCVLINLCYKNLVVILLFLRAVNVAKFSAKIQNYGMLANKMLIILSKDMYTLNEREMCTFLRSTFASIGDCLKHWNVPHLKHIIDFMMDSKSHQILHEIMIHYDKYCEDIAKLLDQLEERGSMDDSNEEAQYNQQICLGLIFQLIRYILELGAIRNADGSENIISLDSIIPRIYELLCSWLESDKCGIDAVNLLEVLVRLGKKDTISQRIAREPQLIERLICVSEKVETSSQNVSRVLLLLLALLHQSKTEKLILSKITESYFDKIFSPLLATIKKNMEYTYEDIEKPIFCLLLLINFAGIAKKAYFDKCCTLLQMEPIQLALAYGMLSGNQMSRAVFEISKFEHFPQLQVAQHISKLRTSRNNTKLLRGKENSEASEDCNTKWHQLNALFKSNTLFGKEIEERLNGIIDVLNDANNNRKLQNVATSQIIELFNYKLEKYRNSECSMQQRLDDASKQITELSHRLNVQNAELNKYNIMNLELHINHENLQMQCRDLKQQKDNLKNSVSDFIKKLSEKSELYQICEKRLEVKNSELIVIQKNYKELKEDLQVKSDAYEKLQTTMKENVSRIDKMKKSLSAYEVEIKEKMHTIEERDKELLRTQKQLDEQKECRKKAEDLINVLEVQLQKKNEELHNCEMELSETEEMRKTIMSLMESKKPKRKL